jgi:small-conductance mechanosensitive channel
VFGWNLWGIACLCVIAVVAMASSPMVRAFGDDPAHVNRWVTTFPFVWLPTILVVAAIAGHVIVWRKLSTQQAARHAQPA